MDNVRLFFQFLQRFSSLREDEFDRTIKPFLQVRQFKKKDVVSTSAEVENFFNFIIKGLIRKYLKKGKEEINIQIATEGQVIYSGESFYSRKPSEYIVEAIEPSAVISVEHQDMERIFSSSAKMERMGRLMVSFEMILKDRWQMNMIRLNPRERFLNFVEKNPDLLRRVPQKFLASFLNIQPETFSRFKHMLKEKSSLVLPH